MVKKDPLSIASSLLLNLNLLREGVEYNINEIKSLRNIENHWKTIQKYLKMCKMIKDYFPVIEMHNSKLIIKYSELYRRLDQSERFILYLYNNDARDSESAVSIPEGFQIEELSAREDYLYKRTGENKFYLTKSGIGIFRLIKENLTELIFQEKSFDELFPHKIEEQLETIKINNIFLKDEMIFFELHIETSREISAPVNLLSSADSSEGEIKLLNMGEEKWLTI